MSHFIGLVFGSDVEELLAPYSETLEVEPYVAYTKDEAVNKVREQIISQYEYAISEKSKHAGSTNSTLSSNIYAVIERGTYVSYEDAWEEAKTWGYEIDEEENLLSTYNSDSKWDWYTEGGRWEGYIPVVGRDEEDETMYENAVFKFEVDWGVFFDRNLTPFCFVTTDGEWHESGKVGWWGTTTDDKEEEAWKQEFKEYLDSIPDDTEITAIDFHI